MDIYHTDINTNVILCSKVDGLGCHPVGYFSKEWDARTTNNLACILVLPQHQRKG